MTRGRKRILLALGVAATLAVAIAPVAAGHTGPPTSWKRCKTAYGSGDGVVTVRGVIYARANTATSYKVRIRPALPFGWSGTVTANRQTHPRIWIFPGRTHWFPSAIVFTGYPSGRYGYRVDVSPNPGMFNNYAIEIWAYYRCS